MDPRVEAACKAVGARFADLARDLEREGQPFNVIAAAAAGCAASAVAMIPSPGERASLARAMAEQFAGLVAGAVAQAQRRASSVILP